MYEIISNFISNLIVSAVNLASSELVVRYYRFMAEYSKVILFFIPLGIIGAWRWGVWLIKKFISFFYRSPEGYYSGTLGIVTPVYNENPAYFRTALESWKENSPAEIIAVIDSSDSQNIEEFEDFAENFYGARLIVTSKPGKRPALADGILAAKSEIVALVDSDTIWSEGIIPQMVAPFSDSEVGGVGPRQDVLEPRTLAQRLFKIRLDNRFYNELTFLAAAGDALTCLSGRTAVYRREALLPHLEELVNEKLWGRKLISGDDKTLTRLVQQSGWKTKYLDNVIVYTPGFPNMRAFLKQIVRWSRNSWRSDMKTLGSPWVWKRGKALALHMIDRFFPPFTMLLGPIYFLVSIFYGYWQGALILFAWWMISRAVKIFPHLREKPEDLLILPIYVVMTYVESLIKLYALITLDEHEWSTRWDKGRLNLMGPLRKSVAYLATFSIFFGAFFAVFTYKSGILRASQIEKIRAQETKRTEKLQRLAETAIYTPDIPRTSNESIGLSKASLISKSQDNPYGYYIAKAGDTVSVLKSRYNLADNGLVLNAQTKTPLPNFAFLRAGQAVTISVNNLQNPLSTSSLLASDLLRKPPRITYDRISNTIFVAQGGSIVTLSKLEAALGLANPNLLTQTQPGEWILRANLYIGKNVTFLVAAPEASYLKLKSDSQSYVWIRSESGNVLLENTKVTSWNEATGSFDENIQDGRAYIVERNSGRMDILNSEMAYLGHVGLPNRGGPFGGSYGVSWKINNGKFKDNLLTGVVLGSKFHNNYFGIYTYGATGLLIRGNEFYDNIEYGLDPHDDSNNFLVENNSAHNNGNHGIIFSRRCFSNVIRNNVSYNNRLHGIMLDRSSNSNVVEGNTVYGNVDGIALYASDYNIVVGNKIQYNTRGIRLNENSANNYFEQNAMAQNSRGAYIYGGASQNILVENEIQQNTIGITIKGASKNILYDNFVQYSNKRDGRVTIDSYENDIK